MLLGVAALIATLVGVTLPDAVWWSGIVGSVATIVIVNHRTRGSIVQGVKVTQEYIDLVGPAHFEKALKREIPIAILFSDSVVNRDD